MLKQLLSKEFKLANNPAIYLMYLVAFMIITNTTPAWLPLLYILMAFHSVYYERKATKDILFTSLLPVSKKDIITSHILFAMLYQTTFIIILAVVYIIGATLGRPSQVFGMNPNVAFFGFAFILYGIFNLVFFSGYFKTANKLGWPMVFGVLSVFAFVFFAEIFAEFIPVTKEFLNPIKEKLATLYDGDTVKAASEFTRINLLQTPILVCGIIINLGLNALAIKCSYKRFQKVDI